MGVGLKELDNLYEQIEALSTKVLMIDVPRVRELRRKAGYSPSVKQALEHSGFYREKREGGVETWRRYGQ